MIRACDYCRKEYECNEQRLKWGRERFCSRECSYRNRGDALKKLVTTNCMNCNKEIKRTPSSLQYKYIFCSIKCKAEAMGKKIIPSARLGSGKPKDKLTEYYKRKYFKYRAQDLKRNHKTIDIGSNEFAKIFTDKTCHYCGDTEQLGLDRIDNTKGHTLDNIVFCCELCNMTRGDRYTVNEFIQIGKIINDIKQQRRNGRGEDIVW